MEERKLITAAWGVTKNGRRARYYKLTARGKAELKAQAAALAQHVSALTAVLSARTAR
jgi:DNA-binding PadR family transcriptional regulator